MIFVGDKIELVKPMGLLKEVGTICEVTKIEDGVITFNCGNYHNGLMGCMSYDEYEKYFKPYEEQKPTKKWTDWEEAKVTFIQPLTGMKKLSTVFVRNNGKVMEMKFNNKIKTRATCNFKAGDNFDKRIALEICELRLIKKYFDERIDNTIKCFGCK